MLNRGKSLLDSELVRISTVLIVVLMFFYSDIVFQGRSFIMGPRIPGVTANGTYGFTGVRGSGFATDAGAIAWEIEPWTELIRNDYKRMELPLWNPHQGLGAPFLGNAQSAPVDPIVFFVYLVPDSLLTSAIDLHLLLRYFLGGLFTYLFLREIKVSPAGATTAAIAFMLSSYFVLHGNIVYIRADILLPMLLYSYHLLAHSPSGKTFALAVLALTLTILTGFPETLPLQLGLASSWYIFQVVVGLQGKIVKTLRNKLFWLLAAVTCGILLSAFVLLPFIEYLRLADHAHHPSTATAMPLIGVLRILPTFIIPLNYWIPQNLEVWALVLALSGFWAVIKNKKPKTPAATTLSLLFFVTIATVLVLILCFTPLTVFARSLPILNMISLQLYPIPLLTFCVACAAGIGLDFWMLDKIRLPEVSGVVKTLFLTVLIFAFVIPSVHYPENDTLFVYLIYILIAFYGLTFLKDSWPRGRSYLAWVVVIGMAILPTLWYRGSEHTQRYDLFTEPPFVEFLKAQSGPFRILGLDYFLYPDSSSAFGIDDVRYLDAVFPESYVEYRRKLVSTETNTVRFVGDEEVYFDRGLNLLNVEYVVTSRYNETFSFRPNWSLFPPATTTELRIKNDSYLVLDPESTLSWPIRVPVGNSSLTTGFALSPKTWLCKCAFLDGASFEIRVKSLADDNAAEQTVFQQYIDPVHVASDRRWFSVEVDLSAWSGQRVQISLVKTGSPEDDLDLAYWGVPAITATDYPDPDCASGGFLTDFFSTIPVNFYQDGTRPGIFSQPPSTVGIGLQLFDTEHITLRFEMGLDEARWSSDVYSVQDTGDGVTFSVRVLAQGDEQVVFEQYIDPKNNPEQRRWNSAQVDLSPWKGERVYLQFETDDGPQGDATFDWAYWSNIRVTDEQGASAFLVDTTPPSLHPVYQDGLVTIYRNPNAFPRAFVVYEAESVAGLQQALDRLSDADFNPAETVLIEGDLPSTIEKQLSTGSQGFSQVQVTDRGANTITIQATTDQPGFLVVSEQYFPGWKVYVDGDESQIYKANGTMRAVFLEEGTHKVEFRYRPMSFILGTVLSGSTLLVLIAIYIVSKSGIWARWI